MGTLYLIPNTLGDSAIQTVIPTEVQQLLPRLKHYIVENIRTTRRYLKRVEREFNELHPEEPMSIVIDDLTFYELNQHTDARQVSEFLKPLKQGQDMGIISEAGCPAIADPGADVVALAQEAGIKVVPLVGPSSILLSLMASGFNGQSFAFNGYLPIEPAQRAKRLRQLEQRAHVEHQSQLFIETPYRNMKMLETILQICQPQTRVCIACDITLPTEYIRTQSVASWKKQKELPDLKSRPCIFVIY